MALLVNPRRSISGVDLFIAVPSSTFITGAAFKDALIGMVDG